VFLAAFRINIVDGEDDREQEESERSLISQRSNFQENESIITAPYANRVAAAPRTPNQGISITLSNNDSIPAARLLRATHFA
jgi:hypothetical protein